MIRFRCNYWHRDGTPIVKDVAVEHYAEQVLADYQPRLLKEPGRIDGLRFLEDYLGAVVNFADIYNEAGNGTIAEATVFNDGKVRVIDKDARRIRTIDVPANTILISDETMEHEGFALFTMLHEAGHFSMHRAAYQKSLYEISLELFANQMAARQVIFCRQSDIKGSHRRLITQEDFREHQANVFAAAMAMPREVFRETVREFVRDAGMGEGPDDIVVLHGWRAYGGYSVPKEQLYRKIAKTFGVSRTAVKVQMQSRGLLMSDTLYEKKYGKTQIVV